MKKVSIEIFRSVLKAIGVEGIISGLDITCVPSDPEAQKVVDAIKIIREQQKIIKDILENN